MDTPQALHPTDEILHARGLGQLDQSVTASIDQHLETCQACRRRVGELSGRQLFLGGLRGDSGSPVDVGHGSAGVRSIQVGLWAGRATDAFSQLAAPGTGQSPRL